MTSLCFAQGNFKDYISSTVNIKFEENRGASGFLYSSKSKNIYLVTAKHTLLEFEELSKQYQLIETACEVTYFFRTGRNNLGRISKQLDLDYKYIVGEVAFSEVSDVAIIELGEMVDSLISIPYQALLDTRTDSSFQYIYSESDVATGENILEGHEVYVFGYPRSVGLISRLQFDQNRPLIRSGTIASLDEENNTIIIDALTFEGNSGGPVIQNYNFGVYDIIGVVSEYIPYDSDGSFVGNSGFTVVEPISEVIKLIEEYEK